MRGVGLLVAKAGPFLYLVVAAYVPGKESDMRRLLVTFIIPASALASIILLFNLLTTAQASALPSLSDESGLQAVDQDTISLPEA